MQLAPAGDPPRLGGVLLRDSWRSSLGYVAAAADQPAPVVATALRRAMVVGLAVAGRGNMEKAMEVLDRKGSVERVRAAPSGRSFFEVAGAKGERYTCYDGFCSCKAFEKGLHRPDFFLCKHGLACGLAEALGKCPDREVTDDEYADALLCSCTSLEDDGSLTGWEDHPGGGWR